MKRVAGGVFALIAAGVVGCSALQIVGEREAPSPPDAAPSAKRDAGNEETSRTGDPCAADCPTCQAMLLYSEGIVDPDPEKPPPTSTPKIAIDRDHVFFPVCEGRCRLRRVGKDGSGATTLADIGITVGQNMAVDDAFVYVTGQCSNATRACAILRIPKDGGLPQVVTNQNVGSPGPMMIDDDFVYWYATDRSNNDQRGLGIQRIRKDGTGQTTLVLDPALSDDVPEYRVKIAQDGDSLYYSFGTFEYQIKRLAKTGGVPQLLFASASLEDNAGDAQELFLSNDHVVWSVSFPQQPSIWGMMKTGADVRQLVPPLLSGAHLDAIGATSDETGDVVWGEGHPSGASGEKFVIKKRLANGTIVELGHTDDEKYTSPAWGRIKTDERAIYFTPGTTRLFRVDRCPTPQ